jgi:hypothetical protein
VIGAYGYISWLDPEWNKSDLKKFGHIKAQEVLTLPPPQKKDDDEELYCDVNNFVYTEDELWTLLGEGCGSCTRVPDFDDIVDNENNIIIPTWKNDVGEIQYLCPACSAISANHPHNH